VLKTLCLSWGPLTIFAISLAFSSSARADEFMPLDSIPSEYYVYYTTMAPHGNFMAMGDQRSPGAGVDIIDITDPANMLLITHIPTGHMTYELDWEGDYIYCPASWDGLFIYNVADFNNVTLVYDSSFGAPMSSIAVRNNAALLGGQAGLFSLNVSDPSRPAITSHLPQIIYFNIVLGDSIAYAFREYAEVLFINIVDPLQPYLIDRFPCPDIYGLDVDEASHRLFGVSAEWGLRIYDIQDIFQPTMISETPIPNGWAIDVDYSAEMPDKLVVSAYTGGVCAVDITDPANPHITASWPSAGQSNYVLIYKNTVYNTSPDILFSLMLNRSGSGVGDDSNAPAAFSLQQNYPNPFNSSTSIRYTLPYNCNLTMEIYNVLGQRVTTLVNGYQAPGSHSITWNAIGQPSGPYLIKISGDDFCANRTILLVK